MKKLKKYHLAVKKSKYSYLHQTSVIEVAFYQIAYVRLNHVELFSVIHIWLSRLLMCVKGGVFKVKQFGKVILIV